MNKTIILYTTGCPKCRVLERELSNKKIPFTAYTDQRGMVDMGFSSVPQLDVDGELKDFSQAMLWVKAQ